jgi:hypothetical protein
MPFAAVITFTGSPAATEQIRHGLNGVGDDYTLAGGPQVR